MAAWIDLQKEGVSNYLKNLVDTDMYNSSLTTEGPALLKQAEILAETDSRYQPKQ